jgi:hypothetical protein
MFLNLLVIWTGITLQLLTSSLPWCLLVDWHLAKTMFNCLVEIATTLSFGRRIIWLTQLLNALSFDRKAFDWQCLIDTDMTKIVDLDNAAFGPIIIWLKELLPNHLVEWNFAKIIEIAVIMPMTLVLSRLAFGQKYSAHGSEGCLVGKFLFNALSTKMSVGEIVFDQKTRSQITSS